MTNSNFYNVIGMNVKISRNSESFWNEVISVIDDNTVLCKVNNHVRCQPDLQAGSLILIDTNEVFDYILPE